MNESHDLSQFLKERDRILMAAWMLPNEGPLTEAQKTQALGNFDAYRKRHDLTFADIARQVNSPRESTIRELMKGVYRENADDHIRSLNNWVEQYARQEAVKLKGAFVSTGVAQDILHVAKLTRENATMGVVVGPTGIGKTKCAQALAESIVGSILVTIRSGAYHPKGLTTMLADACKVRIAATSSSQYEHLTQLERVIACLQGTNRLVIIDEAHKLNNDALELVREIHDATRCPVFMLATKDLQDRIRRDADPDHGQLYGRIEFIWPLTQGKDINAGGTNKPLFTIDEIKKLFDQVPIRLATDAARYLQDIANNLGMGSIRRCKILLTSAARRARKRCGVDENSTVTVTADDLAYTESRLRPDASDVEAVKRRGRMATAAVA